MTMTPAEPTDRDRDDIQGNLAGFNKDHQRLLFVQFPDPEAGKSFLGALHPELTSAKDVLEFNHAYKLQVIEKGEDPLSLQSTGVNIALSFEGLSLITPDVLAAFPAEFQAGMRGSAATIGDVDESDPQNWLPPFAPGGVVHAIIMLAADTLDDRSKRSYRQAP